MRHIAPNTASHHLSMRCIAPTFTSLQLSMKHTAPTTTSHHLSTKPPFINEAHCTNTTSHDVSMTHCTNTTSHDVSMRLIAQIPQAIIYQWDSMPNTTSHHFSMRYSMPNTTSHHLPQGHIVPNTTSHHLSNGHSVANTTSHHLSTKGHQPLFMNETTKYHKPDHLSTTHYANYHKPGHLSKGHTDHWQDVAMRGLAAVANGPLMDQGDSTKGPDINSNLHSSLSPTIYGLTNFKPTVKNSHKVCWMDKAYLVKLFWSGLCGGPLVVKTGE